MSFPSRRWLLGLLTAVYTCAFIDRILVSMIGPAIIKDLHLSDAEFGWLGGMAFAIFYALLSIPVAWLAERRARITIIALAAALWSGLTMLSGLAQSYWQLLLCRLGVGVGEAGCTPPAHSLISDVYAPHERTSALAIYSLGVPIGVAIGAVSGGWLADTFSWRTAFAVVGAPGLVLALLVSTLQEPARGHADRRLVIEPPPSFVAIVTRLLRTRSFLWVLLAAAFTTLASNSVNLFAPTYFVRAFGLSLSKTGVMYGLTTGAASAIAMLASGALVDVAARRDPRWYAWTAAAGAGLAAPLYFLAYTRMSAWPSMTLAAVGVGTMSLYFAPTVAMTQALAPVRMRASASALLLLAFNVLGQGVGPVLMGVVSDDRAAKAFTAGEYLRACRTGPPSPDLADACRHASAHGLQQAILMATAFFVLGAATYLVAARSIRRDLTES